jgi:hypothetical protein
MDSQQIELLGRNLLAEQLLRAGLEIAFPQRDRGVDLIAYADMSERVRAFAAVPIQLKASSRRSFGVDRKYSRFPNLLLVHAWHVDDGQKPEFYALIYSEAVAILEQMPYSKTDAWQKRGVYSTSAPSVALCKLLAKHRMCVGDWWAKIVGAAANPGSTRVEGDRRATLRAKAASVRTSQSAEFRQLGARETMHFIRGDDVAKPARRVRRKARD